jgi:hypothetical protein
MLLEQKIATSLANPHIASVELMDLTRETERALGEAEATAKAERERAFDPVRSPDAAEAERSVWVAEFRRDRLRSFFSQLRQRLAEVKTAERAARFQADYEAVKAKRDALAEELAELYPSLVAQLCDLFQRAETIDQECLRINSAASTGERRRLLGVELTARGLESFGIDNTAITETVKLPEWAHTDRMAWPPAKTPLGVLMAMSMVPHHDLTP